MMPKLVFKDAQSGNVKSGTRLGRTWFRKGVFAQWRGGGSGFDVPWPAILAFGPAIDPPGRVDRHRLQIPQYLPNR